LRNRLEGEVQQYKRLLDGEMLRDPNPMESTTSRDFDDLISSKVPKVFLYRFMQFMKYNRGTMDLQKWMTRLDFN